MKYSCNECRLGCYITTWDGKPLPDAVNQCGMSGKKGVFKRDIPQLKLFMFE